MKYKIGKNQTSKSFVVGAGTDPENLQRAEKGGCPSEKLSVHSRYKCVFI